VAGLPLTRAAKESSVAYDKHRVNPATVPPAQPPPGDDEPIQMRLPPSMEAAIAKMRGECFICSLSPMHGAILLAHAVRHLRGTCPPREDSGDGTPGK
jgi:hypothetical protein